MYVHAGMTKRIPGSGHIDAGISDLFTRNGASTRFSGIASFNDGDSSVLLEVADSPMLRAKGMMGRRQVPESTGMLFTDLEGGAFWMKGCHVPLDIIFLADDGTVTRKYTMPVDNGVRRYAYGDERTAIELPAGFCERHGISEGSVCEWRVW